MLPLPQQLLKNSSWIDFFLKHTLRNSQELLWREARGKKALQSSPWCVWENSWDLAAVFRCWQCPQSCTFLPSEDRSMTNWVLGCRDVTSGMTSPTWMWHPPTPQPFTSALFPERWRPYQAITGILCAAGIEQVSVHRVCIARALLRQ